MARVPMEQRVPKQPPPLRPDPEVRGAPDVPLHRNPTFWVLVATLALWTLGVGGYLAGWMPTWGAIAANAVGTYLGFTVLHESVHRTAHKDSRVNDLMGWVPALSLWFTLDTFRICHSKHHANTNDPELDPDWSVARMPAWLRVWWLLFTVYHYREKFYGLRWERHPWQRKAQATLDVLILASIPLSLALGFFGTWLVLHVVPTLLAGLFLFYTFDYLPHHPHDSTERYRDTRIQPGRIRHWVLLGQNYHLVHHLWVTVPWYRYREVFEQIGEDIVARGGRVDGPNPFEEAAERYRREHEQAERTLVDA